MQVPRCFQVAVWEGPGAPSAPAAGRRCLDSASLVPAGSAECTGVVTYRITQQPSWMESLGRETLQVSSGLPLSLVSSCLPSRLLTCGVRCAADCRFRRGPFLGSWPQPPGSALRVQTNPSCYAPSSSCKHTCRQEALRLLVRLQRHHLLHSITGKVHVSGAASCQALRQPSDVRAMRDGKG